MVVGILHVLQDTGWGDSTINLKLCWRLSQPDDMLFMKKTVHVCNRYNTK